LISRKAARRTVEDRRERQTSMSCSPHPRRALLNVAELTHQIKRQSHVEITLPYFNTAIDHINTAARQVKSG